jgi:xylulokinase
MTARSPVVVGIDLGTSAMKGVLLDPDGRVVARARAAYATRRAEPTHAEQRPSDWIRALERVASTLARTVPASAWKGIGLSGMIPSLVMLDRRGEVLAPSLTWEDSRAEADAFGLRRRIGARALYAKTGQWVDGRYALPMWHWIAARTPAVAERAAVVMGAKDYLLRWLTGETATDPSTATGFGCFDLERGAWDMTIADACGVGGSAGPRLPSVVASTDAITIGRETAHALGAGPKIPVLVGAADSVLSADVLGGVGSGDIAYVSGTSTVIVSFHDRFVPDARHRYLVTPASRPGRFGYEMDLLSTGSAMRWCASLLGLGPRGEGEVLSLAERATAGDGLTFLPYLAPGEQGAIWDPDLRGSLVGLTLRDGPADIARALVDGIVLESRRCVGVLRARGANPTIRATGPMARAAWFRRRLADATGCEVVLTASSSSAAAVGAAALSDPALGEAVAARSSGGAIVQPAAAAALEWDERWGRHEAARARFTATPR